MNQCELRIMEWKEAHLELLERKIKKVEYLFLLNTLATIKLLSILLTIED